MKKTMIILIMLLATVCADNLVLKANYMPNNIVALNASKDNYAGSGSKVEYNIDVDVDSGMGITCEYVFDDFGAIGVSILPNLEMNSYTGKAKIDGVVVDSGSFDFEYTQYLSQSSIYVAPRININSAYIGLLVSYDSTTFMDGDVTGISTGLILGLNTKDLDHSLTLKRCVGESTFDDGFEILNGNYEYNQLYYSIGFKIGRK